jgi:DNA-binding NtrC family response regulator
MPRAQIILVEDDEDYRELLDDFLHSLGHSVVDFSSTEEALSHIEREGGAAPCLVLTDLRTGGRSGLELAIAVKRARRDLPVIMMTAYGDRRLAREASEAGVDVYIEKPFRLAELARLVDSLLPRPPTTDGGAAA